MYDFMPIALACVVVALAVYAVRWHNDPLRAIPTVGGSSLPGLSYLGALRTLGDFREVLEEGYRKHPESAFKIATFDRWVVVVSGRSMVEELRKRPEDELSGPVGFHENFQSKYVFEPAVLSDRYHRGIARETLVKKLSSFLPDLINEVFTAVEENIVTRDNEWTSVAVMPAMGKILARASSRTFVGLPLCRNEEYLSLAASFGLHFVKGAGIIRFFPDFMKRLVAPFVTEAKDNLSRAAAHLRPIVEERTKALSDFGEEWDDKPNDLLQDILEKGIPRGETVSAVTQRLFIFNFASIGTSSSIIINALYHLAERQDLVTTLREEVQMCISADGWTGTALGNMWQLDSFLRETLRYYGVGLVSMHRMVLKDVILHDGTRIPRGTLVSANVYPLHHDTALLDDADTFDPFRFARMRNINGQSMKHQFTSTSPEYIGFGYGPRACPGRFLASNTLKAVLAYIILAYDLKLAGDGVRPPTFYVSLGVVPPRNGHVLFKARGGSSVRDS